MLAIIFIEPRLSTTYCGLIHIPAFAIDPRHAAIFNAATPSMVRFPILGLHEIALQIPAEPLYRASPFHGVVCFIHCVGASGGFNERFVAGSGL